MNIQYVIIKEDYVLTIIELLTGHISSIVPLSFLYFLYLLKDKKKRRGEVYVWRDTVDHHIILSWESQSFYIILIWYDHW